jgi:hypothetical protein
MLAAAPLLAQQDPKQVRKIIEVKYADPRHVAEAIRIFNVSAGYDSTLHVVSVGGFAEQVAAAEEAIKKLDVAPVNVELTVYLVNGWGPNHQGVSGDEVPADLTGTIKQLHALFNYKTYRLTESFVLRGRDGSNASTSGQLPGSTMQNYSFGYVSATVSSGTPRVVHIDRMDLEVHTPNGRNTTNGETIYRTASIATNLDAAEGQKIVVGKSNINGTDDAMILVVTAKIVQ